jgi:hypothetical protein
MFVDSYTLADLERVTGAKRRSLQLWADAGVIEAIRGTNRAGTGTHRRFSRREAIIACCIHGFALHQMAIGELFHVSLCLRVWFEVGQEQAPARVESIIRPAIKGEGDALLVVESWKDDSLNPSPNLHSNKSKDVDSIRLGRAVDPSGRQYVLSIFAKAKSLELHYLNETEGFAMALRLKTYLSKIDV